MGLPALLRAEKLQRKAAKIGFDWPNEAPVLAKVMEELEEFAKAGTSQEKEEEMGDLLFALVNLARHHQINPEEALRKANKKFERRFRRVEELTGATSDKRYPLPLLDEAWDKAKAEEK